MKEDEKLDEIKQKFLEAFFPDKKPAEIYTGECFEKVMGELTRLKEAD